HLDDGVIGRIGHVHDRLRGIELDAIGAKGWEAIRRQDRRMGRGRWRVLRPDGRWSTRRTDFLDDAVEGIGDVDVAGLVEGERVEAGPWQDGGGEDRRRARPGVDIQHLTGAEVDDQHLVSDARLEAETEKVLLRA